MNEEVKEAIALTEKWHKKITEIAIGYEKSIATIDKVRADYKSQTQSLLRFALPYLLGLVSIIVVLIAFGIILNIKGCPNPIDFKFGSLELTQNCKASK